MAQSRKHTAEQAHQRSSRRIWVTAGVITVVLAAGAATLALTMGLDEPLPGPDTQFAAGRDNFEANCAQCHGADLEGVSGMGPSFLDVTYAPNHHGDDAFRSAVANGVEPHHWSFGAMPPRPGLSDDDVNDIIAYVREQQEQAGITVDPSHPS